MEEALRLLLPRIVGPLSHEIYGFQCKDELLERLPDRLRGYARWLLPTWRVVVVVDCRDLKCELELSASRAGLVTRSMDSLNWQVVNRLVIEELEAWYFGDWEAVRAAYPHVPPNVPRQARYRDPDAIRGGTWEALERFLKRAGYFRGGLRKIEAARSIAEHMEPKRNLSHSFGVLREALEELAGR